MDVNKTIESLRRRKFEVSYFDTCREAADYLCGAIKETSVGMGGSTTLDSLGLYERLQESNTVIWHHRDDSPGAPTEAFKARVYLSSANALSETGEIVNIDGRGNRVAATLFDKDEVYIIVGINKITPTLDEAVFRARNVAAPQNAKRLGKNTPCAVKADKCYDCDSSDRICNGLVVLLGKMYGVGKMEVIIIGEELGD